MLDKTCNQQFFQSRNLLADTKGGELASFPCLCVVLCKMVIATTPMTHNNEPTILTPTCMQLNLTFSNLREICILQLQDNTGNHFSKQKLNTKQGQLRRSHILEQKEYLGMRK